MEADGISRIFVIEDRGTSEVVREVYPNKGGVLPYSARHETVDRADVIYTAGNIAWDRPSVHVVKSESILPGRTTRLQVESNPGSLCDNLEIALGKTGLTVLIDRLEPETIQEEDDCF